MSEPRWTPAQRAAIDDRLSLIHIYPQCGKVASGGKNFFQQLLCRHAAGHLPQSREPVSYTHLPFSSSALMRVASV